MKAAFIAIIGRPSAGKSTLLNKICGQHIAITSPFPQTTRNKIRGIYTEERGQLIFIDTPGYHNSEKKLNIYLTDLVKAALDEAEGILYLIDATRPLGQEEREILEMIGEHNLPVTAALNKTEMPEARTEDLAAQIREALPDTPLLPVSALTGEGLEPLKEALFAMAPEGDLLYPEEYYTDQPPEFRIAEVIREEALRHVREEIPHALYVEVADLEEEAAPPPTEKKPRPKDTLWIRAFLTVERQSQVGIVVGRGGAGIKAIRQAAQKELGRLFPQHIRLDLRVKVNPKWRHKDYLLKGMFQ